MTNEEVNPIHLLKEQEEIILGGKGGRAGRSPLSFLGVNQEVLAEKQTAFVEAHNALVRTINKDKKGTKERMEQARCYKVAMDNAQQCLIKVSDLYLDLLEYTQAMGRDAGISPQYRRAVSDIRTCMGLVEGINEQWGNFHPLTGQFK